jgi:hypothetical protein
MPSKAIVNVLATQVSHGSWTWFARSGLSQIKDVTIVNNGRTVRLVTNSESQSVPAISAVPIVPNLRFYLEGMEKKDIRLFLDCSWNQGLRNLHNIMPR